MTSSDVNATGTWREVIAKTAGMLALDGFPRSDLAALRRLNTEAPSAPVFWQMMARYVPGASDDMVCRWALILQGMALMAPHHRAGDPSIGRALRNADFKEARLARFLNARGRQFRAAVPRLARQLAAKGQPIDWRTLGVLILTEGRNERRAEQIRMAIARDYYAALARAAKAS